MGFRLSLSLTHLGPEAGPHLGDPALAGVALRSSEKPSQRIEQTLQHDLHPHVAHVGRPAAAGLRRWLLCDQRFGREKQ